jgi:predicted secreted protein
MEELLAQMTRQPPVVEGSAEPAAAATEEAATTEAQEEAPAEAGLVDIASILGAPTVTSWNFLRNVNVCKIVNFQNFCLNLSAYLNSKDAFFDPSLKS